MKHILRPLIVRPVLSLSFAAGFGAAALMPGLLSVERLLAGWCLATLLFVVVVSYRLGRLSSADLKLHVGEHDEGAVIILCLSMVAAAASFAGVAYELRTIHNASSGTGFLAMPLMVSTIMCSWFFIHTVFTIHYASLYYNPPVPHSSPTLDFGGDREAPDYWDFVYFSVAIGCSSATSDTNLHSRTMRRLVAAHSVFSFFFNATILALAINIAAGLLGGT